MKNQKNSKNQNSKKNSNQKYDAVPTFSKELKQEKESEKLLASKIVSPVVVSPVVVSPVATTLSPVVVSKIAPNKLAILTEESNTLLELASKEPSKKLARRYKVLSNDLLEINTRQLKRCIGRFPKEIRDSNKVVDELLKKIVAYYQLG